MYETSPLTLEMLHVQMGELLAVALLHIIAQWLANNRTDPDKVPKVVPFH